MNTAHGRGILSLPFLRGQVTVVRRRGSPFSRLAISAPSPNLTFPTRLAPSGKSGGGGLSPLSVSVPESWTQVPKQKSEKGTRAESSVSTRAGAAPGSVVKWKS